MVTFFLLCTMQRNYQMIYNVKRFRNMMKQQEQRQSSLPAYSHASNKSKQLNFATMVAAVDLGSKDFLAKPMKAMKDQEKIDQFFANKSSYYKNLGPKQAVYRTGD